ncbi:MAG: ABC transporter substrate-binding protein [Vicinamibacteraceae bacterium]
MRYGRAIILVLMVALAGAAAMLWWGRSAGPRPPGEADGGGQLRTTMRTEPRSFNRLVANDGATGAVGWLIDSPLVSIDPRTFDLVPVLAETVTASDDGRTWTIVLREGVRFSDGAPFTAADVLFTLDAIYDRRSGSVLAEALQVNGQPLTASAPDPHTVVLTAAAPLGAGLRMLADVPILPKHKLEAALAGGRFREARSLSTPTNELVGLGPFVLHAYRPGERLTFRRNPRYWRRDREGSTLPYVDEVTIDIVPDQNAEVLRLFGGQSDAMYVPLRPEDLPEARRLEKDGRLTLYGVGEGVSTDFLWLNLVPGANRTKPWLQRLELRQAISLAIDRRAFADTVYLGEGVPVSAPVTPGNRRWHAADLPVPKLDVARARELLASIGVRDRNGDGMAEAAAGQPARITLLTHKGNTVRARAASVIQHDLRSIGLRVDVVSLDLPALIDRWTRRDYEAIYFGTQVNDTDPAALMDLWLSSGAFHVWHPNQPRPATAWEAEIDRLMLRQTTTMDEAVRRRLFNRVQHIFADHLPVIHVAVPRLTVASSARVRGFRPGPLHPYLLWQASTIQLQR